MILIWGVFAFAAGLVQNSSPAAHRAVLARRGRRRHLARHPGADQATGSRPVSGPGLRVLDDEHRRSRSIITAPSVAAGSGPGRDWRTLFFIEGAVPVRGRRADAGGGCVADRRGCAGAGVEPGRVGEYIETAQATSTNRPRRRRSAGSATYVREAAWCWRQHPGLLLQSRSASTARTCSAAAPRADGPSIGGYVLAVGAVTAIPWERRRRSPGCGSNARSAAVRDVSLDPVLVSLDIRRQPPGTSAAVSQIVATGASTWSNTSRRLGRPGRRRPGWVIPPDVGTCQSRSAAPVRAGSRQPGSYLLVVLVGEQRQRHRRRYATTRGGSFPPPALRPLPRHLDRIVSGIRHANPAHASTLRVIQSVTGRQPASQPLSHDPVRDPRSRPTDTHDDQDAT